MPIAGKRVRRRRQGMALDEVIMSKQSRLLELPAELRNTIYEMVLIQPDSIDVKLKAIRVNNEARLIAYSIAIPPLLVTCRAIHGETVKLFFSANAFTFPAAAYLAKSPISFTNMRPYIPLMRKVKLRISHETNCKSDHIYNFDLTGGMALQAIGLEDVLYPGYFPRRWPCHEARNWEDALVRELDSIVKSGEGNAELEAHGLENLIGVLRYQGFP